MRKLIATILFSIVILITHAQTNIGLLKDNSIKSIDGKYDGYKNIALQIWGFAEVGYKEVKSTQLLQETLKNNGFTIQSGVADIPTAFVASYGSGKPVIAILAEYDALPGLSQQAIPEKIPASSYNYLLQHSF